MKKSAISLMLVLMLAFSFIPNSFAADNSYLIMALNSTYAVANGTPIIVNMPLMAFGKMYVDLYETAPHLGVELCWIGGESPYYTAKGEGGSADLHIIAHYDELGQTNKLFVKNDRVFIAARDLATIAGVELDFENWVITFRRGYEANSIYKPVYDGLSLENVDSYINSTYTYPPTHPIYPYQAYSYDFLKTDALYLQKMYPDLIKVSSIGQSVEGRDMILIELGKGSRKIFVCGAHHAREYISSTYLMYAIDRYAYMYRTGMNETPYDIKSILDNVTFCIMPMVNPDGVNLVQNGLSAVKNPDYVSSMSISEGAKYGYRAWKANVNGVDVNWNYDKDWSSSKNRYPRGSIGFNGTQPNSEPETQAVAAYVDSQPFEAFLSMHTQGKLLYWAEDTQNPTNLGPIVKGKTGFSITYEKATGVGGSFFDYVYRKYGKATMTVELCNYVGPYPYPDTSFDEVWSSAKDVLLIFGDVLKNR